MFLTWTRRSTLFLLYFIIVIALIILGNQFYLSTIISNTQIRFHLNTIDCPEYISQIQHKTFSHGLVTSTQPAEISQTGSIISYTIPPTSRTLKLQLCETPYIEVSRIEVGDSDRFQSINFFEAPGVVCHNCQSFIEPSGSIKIITTEQPAIFEINNLHHQLPRLQPFPISYMRYLPLVGLGAVLLLLLVGVAMKSTLHLEFIGYSLLLIGRLLFRYQHLRQLFPPAKIDESGIVAKVHFVGFSLRADTYIFLLIFAIPFFITLLLYLRNKYTQNLPDRSKYLISLLFIFLLILIFELIFRSS